jgi:2-keto-3-deoxy-L-rhamnonate aldolase RhmA
VIAAIESIVVSAGQRKLATAIYAPTAVLARRWIDLGVRVVAMGYDTATILEAFTTACLAVLNPDPSAD